MEMFVDRVDESNFLGQFVKEWNASKAESLGAVTEIEADVAATKDGLTTIGKFRFIEAALDLALASGDFFFVISLSLENPLLWSGEVCYTLLYPRKRQGFSSFFVK